MKFYEIFFFTIFTIILQKALLTNPGRTFCGNGKFNFKKPTIAISHISIRRLQEQQYEPIRIAIDYSTFDKQDFPDINKTIIKQTLEIATNSLQKLINIKRRSYLEIPPSFYVNYGIEYYDQKYVNKIEGVDLIIHPELYKFDSQGTLATGNWQYGYPDTGPCFGRIWINTLNNFNIINSDKYFTNVAIHELTHVLGFTHDTFPMYPNGGSLLKTKIINGQTRTLFTGKNVVEQAKKYFGCQEIEGIELENQGSNLTQFEHWEGRIMLGDYMCGTMYEECVISEITLGLLEDSGWYKPNYYTGGLMRYGKKKGCEFLNQKCVDSNMQSNFKNEFYSYNINGLPMCFPSRLGMGNNVLHYDVYSTIPDAYNYFYNNHLFNNFIEADYCPVPFYDFYYTTNFYQSNCKHGIKGLNGRYYNYSTLDYLYPGYPDMIGESYSNNSFCVLTSLMDFSTDLLKYPMLFRANCLEMYCSDKSLTISIDDKYYVCPREGGKIPINGYLGYIICPDYNTICTGTVICNTMVDCIDKESKPRDNTFYYDYTPVTNQDIIEMSNIQVSEGYEQGETDNKCSSGCVYCEKTNKATETEDTNCKQCRENFVFAGKSEFSDEGKNIYCLDKALLSKYGYFNKNGIYYACLNGCKACDNSLVCNECQPYAKMNEDKTKCLGTEVIHCLSYNNGVCEKCEEGYEIKELSCVEKKGFPGWAIALIVILGVALIVSVVLIIICLRKRSSQEETKGFINPYKSKVPAYGYNVEMNTKEKYEEKGKN